MKARALKDPSDALHIGYYDQDGTLQVDDEYGYCTHDINRLLSIDEIKSFPAPIKEVIVSIKDESGVVLLSMPAKLNQHGGVTNGLHRRPRADTGDFQPLSARNNPNARQ